MTATGENDALTRAYAGIIAEARAHVAAAREPNAQALEARIRAAAEREREGAGEERAQEVARAERAALKQLDRILSVHRARARLAAPQAPPPRTAGPLPGRRAAIRTRPTITANMDVRRRGEATLEWDAAPAVLEWEVRFSERPDAGGEYAVRETTMLPGAATSVDLPLGDRSLRVHLLGRGRGGKLVRRAMISGLTRAGWTDRWQQRGSAA